MAATIDNRVAELERANAQLRRQLDACSAELKEARDQQTATAEVLQVINSSPGDLAPVFDTILEKAHTLCGAAHGIMMIRDGERFRTVAVKGVGRAFVDAMRQLDTIRPREGGGPARLIQGEQIVQFPDLQAESFLQEAPPQLRRVIEIGDARTMLMVPLRKDDDVIGIITAFRQEVRLFTNKQIALLQNFAAQAVIAMENARLITETHEALEQQTATAEVLQVINSSPGDLAPVFDAILEKAHTLCGAAHGSLTLAEGEHFRAVAMRGMPERFAEVLRRPFHAGPLGEQLLSGKPFVQIADIATDELTAQFATDNRVHNAAIGPGGVRTLLAVPLRKDGALLGYITANRQEVRPFSDKEIALLQNFAAQAVIAMENARLLTETREALEQQTATAEVLQVINSSPGDLTPVFDAILEKAHTLCGAAHGSLNIYDGEFFHAVATHGQPEAFAAVLRRPRSGSPVHQRLQAGERLVQIADMKTLTVAPSDIVTPAAIKAGIRTQLFVPLRKDRVLLGYITAHRREVRPFSEKDIALLENFAAQAVIAMENARLITETREALEQQTATAEVLQVINNSPGDLAPVFDAILEQAHTLCGAASGGLVEIEGEQYRAVAVHGEPRFAEYWMQQGWIDATTGALAQLRQGEPLHLPDITADDGRRYSEQYKQLIELSNARSVLMVPMRKDNTLLGAITALRQEVRPFAEREIALLQNFAAQAVIAMENARLITETREALEQQTATAEVLQVINSSPGDLAPVFDAMLERAVRLCEFDFSSLWTFDETVFRPVARHGVPERFWQYLQAHTPPPFARVVAGERLVHISDVQSIPALMQTDFGRGLLELGIEPPRSLLIVSLRKDDALLGVIVAYRHEVRPFSDKQIALLQNFAAQAVIAMENARLITETREALEQQTATAEVLQVINSSPGDLAPVFDAILEKAHSLCGVAYGSLELYDGERFRSVAEHGLSDSFASQLRQGYRASDSPATQPLLAGNRFTHIADAAEVDFPIFRSAAELEGIRTVLFVPLRRDDALLGMIACARREVRPFSEKEIALLENFAAQAVIAMENARLITETREALEQQTATAEVLQVINSSPGDLVPVFDTILEKAHTLCGAAHGIMMIRDGERFRTVAVNGVGRAFVDAMRQLDTIRPREGGGPARLIQGDQIVQFPDLQAESFLQDAPPQLRRVIEIGDARTMLMVPLRKDDDVIGIITAFRQEVRLFTNKQIALLQNFAAQAVIAMENARLITETREALEQQTATAEVLQVINSSPGDLTPVVDAMLERAVRLCGAVQGVLWFIDGERLKLAGTHRIAPAFIEALRKMESGELPAPPQLRRLMAGERIVHIDDVAELDIYRAGSPLARAAVETGLVRTLIWVALVKEGTTVGAFAIARREVRPFSEKQIALLQNFAAQAVIAMENARLITETREALEQQTATAEVLQVINSSPGELAPVFDAILEKAHSLCGAVHGVLQTYDGEHFRAVAMRGIPEKFAELLRQPFRPTSGAPHERLLRGERLIHIPDVAAREPTTPIARAAADAGERTVLFVPLRKDDGLLGYITAYRKEVRPFSDKEIALLENFAAQAVIAMENARLLGELRQRTSDLEESLEYQTAISDVLKVISRSVFDLEPVLQTVLSRATDLCRSPVAEIFRLHDGGYRWAAGLGVEPEYEEIERRSVIQPGPDTLVGRVALERRMVHVADVLEDPLYGPKQEARLGKFRTMLGVPLLRDDMVIGVIAIARWIVEPYTDKEIRLVTTFADQAVIAIENARLLGELRERTAELGRSVEELKMLGEVGRAVSSTLDLRAVLSTILTASLGMTWATAGAIFRYIRAERAFRLVEAVGWDQALLGSVGDLSIAETETLMSEAALSRTPIQLTDLAELPSTRLRDASLAAGLHSVLIVPLVGPERIFGALVLQRREAGEFPAETVRLMQTLASQSVLAIQNARLFREIADKSEQLALASQHKSQFLANMSHELRTPLNAILGYAELLVDGIYGVLPEKAQGVLERVQNNGKHLLALINDVLDLAKIEAGQLALTLEDYALAEVVREVVTATEPLAAAKGLKFTAIVQEGMPMAHGDARRVSQVLLNLAGNAIKFTDAGEVEINASAANGQFVLTVRDTGPGIADADQERIFGEFQQIDNSDTRKRGGTGLGLAISKRMVEMQGGMISVDSVLGAGSTFRVVLPVHVEPALEEAA